MRPKSFERSSGSSPLQSLRSDLCSATCCMFALATQSGHGAPKNDDAVQNRCCLVRHIDFFFLTKWFLMLCKTYFGQTKGWCIAECILYLFIFWYQVKLSSSWPLLAVFSIAKVNNWVLSIYLYIYFSNDSKPSHPTRRGRCLKLPCSPDQLPTALLLFCCFDADHEGLLPWCPAVVSVPTIRSAPPPPVTSVRQTLARGETEPDAQLFSDATINSTR